MYTVLAAHQFQQLLINSQHPRRLNEEQQETESQMAGSSRLTLNNPRRLRVGNKEELNRQICKAKVGTSNSKAPLHDALRLVSNEIWPIYVRVGIAAILQNRVGVYCAPSVDNPIFRSSVGLPSTMLILLDSYPINSGLLSDLALFHVNSNRYCGILPLTLADLTLLHELDLSNNRFVGRFPKVVLSLPSLKYLNLRYNEFEGPLPSELFAKDLDAIFDVFRPPSIAKLVDSLEELLLINTNLSGCLTPEVGFLHKLRVLDVSFNNLVGPIPYSILGLAHLEQLDVAHDMMRGLKELRSMTGEIVYQRRSLRGARKIVKQLKQTLLTALSIIVETVLVGLPCGKEINRS
ncbi:hypothetical protein IFM89_038721 [Coptis chinensis]|uniref:Uncharacterized protein n=1 Tax=Coptis chinensis TaxID=261450 RepID=A0A835H0K4_9MAGN|nr:hypothetical protein IFM89_038721 [Coptis chinensis]